MGSIITSLIGWILGKVFGLVKESRTENKYVDTVRENLELRAQNAGFWKRSQIQQKERDFKKEWEEADEDLRYKILKRDFPDTD